MPSISVHRASKLTGCHPKRLRKLLHVCGHLDSAAMAATDDKAMFDTSRDESFLDRVATAMSMAEARDHLGIPRPHDRLLLEAGHLVPWIRGGTDVLKDHAFARADLDAFLGRLLAGAAPAAGEKGMRSIPDAARQANCSAMEIVALVLDGRLRRRTIDPAAKGYLSLLLDPAEIGPLVRLADPGGLNLREVERRTGLSTTALKELVAAGHMPSRRVVNPVNRCPQDVVDEGDLDAFLARYAVLGRLSAETGIHPRRLRPMLAEAGVLPAFPTVDGSPYEREAIRAAGFMKPAV